MINNKISTDPTVITNSFCAFFTNIGGELDKKIPPSTTNPISYLNGKYTESMFLSPVIEEEVAKAIAKLKEAVPWRAAHQRRVVQGVGPPGGRGL